MGEEKEKKSKKYEQSESWAENNRKQSYSNMKISFKADHLSDNTEFQTWETFLFFLLITSSWENSRLSLYLADLLMFEMFDI